MPDKTKPNPNCQACHGIHVDTNTRQYAACPYCWGDAQVQQKAKNAVKSGRGIIWNAGRFKVGEEYFTPTYPAQLPPAGEDIIVTCEELDKKEFFGCAGEQPLALEDLIRKIKNFQSASVVENEEEGNG